MLVTQRQAIKRLRAETNRSEAWCIDTAKRLAKTKDGERMKLHDRDLDAAIRAENAPPPEPRKNDIGIRPLRAGLRSFV